MSVKRKREDDDQDISNKLNTRFKSVDYEFYNQETDPYISNDKLIDEFSNVKYYIDLLIKNSNITNDLMEYTNLYSELLYHILDINKLYTRRIYSLNELLINDNIQFLNDKYVSGENINVFKHLFTIINKISDFLWTLPISSFRYD
jgi:hypothetical protein